MPLLAAAAALAQPSASPPDPYAAARAAMEQSAARQQAAIEGAMKPALEAQRAAVRRQAESARQVAPAAAPHPFFTTPWSEGNTPLATVAQVAPLTVPDCAPLPSGRIDALIQEAAQREGLTPDLLRAVIRKESNFQPCAVSHKGAQGLMQLMPATAADLNVGNPFDPKQNIDGGSRLLKQLLLRYGGDLSLALGAYNAGSGAVDRHGGVPPFAETLDYVSDILGALR